MSESADKKIEVHPVQVQKGYGVQAVAPTKVTLAAYEVYRHCYGEQRAMIEGHCRGGFGAGELIAFLYARSFPRGEWRQRVDEALTGMRGI